MPKYTNSYNEAIISEKYNTYNNIHNWLLSDILFKMIDKCFSDLCHIYTILLLLESLKESLTLIKTGVVELINSSKWHIATSNDNIPVEEIDNVYGKTLIAHLNGKYFISECIGASGNTNTFLIYDSYFKDGLDKTMVAYAYSYVNFTSQLKLTAEDIRTAERLIPKHLQSLKEVNIII